MNVKKVIAFDYGATSGRAVLAAFDGKKLALSELHRFLNNPVFAFGHLTWDILRLFFDMKQGMINAVSSGNGDVSSVGVDTWGVDFGFLDKYGRLMGNPFNYRDDLAENAMKVAWKIFPKREMYLRTGIQFMRFNTLFQLLAIKNKYPELLQQCETMLFLPDLFNYMLTGQKRAEYSIVSTSQMYRHAASDWDFDMLKTLGIPTSILPKISHAGENLGPILPQISAETGLKNTNVITVCGHDTASAVLAVPKSDGEQSLYLSCGTWSLLGIESDTPIISDAAFDYNYTNEGGYGGNIRFLKNIMGLWVYDECRREWEKFGKPIPFSVIDAETDAAEELRSLFDVDSEEFLTPGNMVEKIQAYCKRTEQPVPETRGQILRCVQESLAMKYRMAIENIEDISGRKFDTLRIIGGGSKNYLLCKYTANATGKRIMVGPIEATATGNVLAQLISLGELSGVSQARQLVADSFPVTEYTREDGEKWDEAYARFRKILQKAN